MKACAQSIGAMALLLAAAAGCGKGGGGKPTGGPGAGVGVTAAQAPQHVEGTPNTDAVVGALKGAGFSTEGFAPLTPVPFGAAYCEQGRVDTIDTVVCEYRDGEALAKGKTAMLEGWGREGGHTGLALASKLTLLGMFDRARHDPNGKVISKAIETFRKL